MFEIWVLGPFICNGLPLYCSNLPPLQIFLPPSHTYYKMCQLHHSSADSGSSWPSLSSTYSILLKIFTHLSRYLNRGVPITSVATGVNSGTWTQTVEKEWAIFRISSESSVVRSYLNNSSHNIYIKNVPCSSFVVITTKTKWLGRTATHL